MSMSNLRLHRWPLAALAVACGSAMGAQINADLAEAVRRDGRADGGPGHPLRPGAQQDRVFAARGQGDVFFQHADLPGGRDHPDRP